MPDQPRSSKKFAISTSDVFGNFVYMTAKTWDVKRDRHPEIRPYFPDEIAETVQNPEAYRHSTAEYAKADTIAFERKVTGTSDTLRVFVQYEKTSFLEGGTTGKITTVYPPSDTGSQGRVGPLIPIGERPSKKKGGS